MLKMFAKGDRNGKPVRLVVLGLSHRNLDKLREGKPIAFGGDTVRLDDDIQFLIFAGEDEKAMQRDFAQFIGPDTELHIDPKLKD